MAKCQLIFIGAPGSGKGTQAKKLVEEFGHKHLSTGDLLRDEIAKESDLGKKVEGVLKVGQLVGDELMLELLKANCDLEANQYIFDGYPRNINQAKVLDEQIIKDRPTRVLYFVIDPEVLVNRLTKRRICKNCGAIYNLDSKPPKAAGVCDECGSQEIYQRNDDKEDVIRERMKVYNEAVSPMLTYYEGKGSLVRIDATRPLNEVYEQVKSSL